VSWQVTGIRQDAWANAHRIPVEEGKSEGERGYYLHPELFNQPEEKGIEWALHPSIMQRMKEARAQKRPENSQIGSAALNQRGNSVTGDHILERK